MSRNTIALESLNRICAEPGLLESVEPAGMVSIGVIAAWVSSWRVRILLLRTVRKFGDDFGSHLRITLRSRLALKESRVCLESDSVFRPHGKQGSGIKQKRIILTTQFSQFSLSAALLGRLDANRFSTPTPVQVRAIPPALEGRDVMATAQTGTGKTLSFLIPIVEMLQEVKSSGAQALILLPTRELAMQVETAFRAIRTNSSQRSALVVGGMAEGPQLDSIRRGARLIVATPGRLEDFLQRKLVRLDQVKILVLDEVDRMLDMGFQPAIARVVAMLPPVRQTLCYSATLEGTVREVARKYLNNPTHIEMGSVLKPAENIELRTFEVDQDKKPELLEHLLSVEQGSFLVFVRTKHGADRLARRLTRSGWSATQIHGDRTQSQRNAALRSFSDGHHRVLVATDVAARGIDVAHVAHVVNYDMPKVVEDFVHRVGRTGRASARGVATTFSGPAERRELRNIECKLSIRMKRFRVRSISKTAA